MNSNPTLPHETDLIHVAWTGLETDLIFNKGIEVPGFASFPLLEDPDTRKMLLDAACDQIRVASEAGLGTVLESVTWMASLDRAAPLGYGAAQLAKANRDAVALLDEARRVSGKDGVLISVNVGPRDDGYAPEQQMSADDATEYHTAQMQSLAGTAVDIVSGYTLTYPAEAVGIVRAAKAAGLPVVAAFTVETDGRLITGQSLDDAIAETDAATGGAAAYFMVSCAHPDHFADTLTGNPRLKGVVVNASRCSHAELDDATELDDGDPQELGAQVAAIVSRFPAINVIGGCCGTDMRHLKEMAERVTR